MTFAAAYSVANTWLGLGVIAGVGSLVLFHLRGVLGLLCMGLGAGGVYWAMAGRVPLAAQDQAGALGIGLLLGALVAIKMFHPRRA